MLSGNNFLFSKGLKDTIKRLNVFNVSFLFRIFDFKVWRISDKRESEPKASLETDIPIF